MASLKQSSLAAVAALVAVSCAAYGAEDILAPFFRKAADKGVPVAGRALRDGTAEIDVLADGAVTRQRFDKAGNVTTTASPVSYDAEMLAKLGSGADAAAAAAAGKADSKEAEVRAVTLVVEDGVAVYHAATYDANGRFYGCHRFTCKDGQWDGWTSAAGERDPLAGK